MQRRNARRGPAGRHHGVSWGRGGVLFVCEMSCTALSQNDRMQREEYVAPAVPCVKPTKYAVASLRSAVQNAVRSGQVDLLREYLASPKHLQAPGISRTLRACLTLLRPRVLPGPPSTKLSSVRIKLAH